MKRIFAVILLCAGLASAAGCDSGTTPTNPSTGSTSVTQVLSGDLTPGGKPIHTFTIPGTAALHITFGSLVGSNGLPLGSTVSLLFGVPNTDATLCSPLSKVSTKVALQAQVNVVASAGLYCASLEDTGSVPSGAHYAIRVVYGTPNDEASAGTIDYTSTVLPTGATSRTFGASASGTATVTLDTLSPASVTSLGLAIGYQRNDGSGCEISGSAVASRGSSFSIPVDAGKYCVKVFDPGTLTEVAGFTLKIVHP